jgi:signal transduction histidine kinase
MVLGSIRTRLAVFFFLITLLAIGVIYIGVAPALSSSLENQRVNELERQVTIYGKSTSQPLEKLAGLKAGTTSEEIQPEIASLQQTTTANGVAILEYTTLADGGLQPTIKFGTDPLPSPSIVDQFGDAAWTSGTIAHGITASGVGVVARRIYFPARAQTIVALFTVNFNNIPGYVVVIRQRILTAAAFALVIVLLLGVFVARALTVRVLRLENAAQRVAQGDFSAHFEVDSNDEIGQLAAALAHMQRQLQELERARRRFVATASHELRTPIFSLGGFLELIQDEELDDETRRQFVGQLREQVDRLGRLATGLLDLSRLEAGSVPIEPTTTDLGVLVRAVSAEFVPALAVHRSKLAVRLPDRPVRAMCDADRVAQLLRILVDNAITHTPPGSTIEVSAEPIATDGSVRVSVTDNGTGIAPEVIPRIFEPFFSADGARGAGLGLAIARELAERMSTTLNVSSGSGSTSFTIVLPGGGERTD